MDEPKKYELQKHIAAVTAFVLDVLVLLYLMSSGLSVRIRGFAETVSNSQWVAVAVYVLAVGVIFKIFDVPIGFYSGYVLARREDAP